MAVDGRKEVCVVCDSILGFKLDHLIRGDVVGHSSIYDLGWTSMGRHRSRAAESSVFFVNFPVEHLTFVFMFEEREEVWIWLIINFTCLNGLCACIPTQNVHLPTCPLFKFCPSLNAQGKSHSLWKAFPSFPGWQPPPEHLAVLPGTCCFVGEPFDGGVFFFPFPPGLGCNLSKGTQPSLSPLCVPSSSQ